MPWTLFVILLILWLAGFIGHVGGSLIHALRVIALNGRRSGGALGRAASGRAALRRRRYSRAGPSGLGEPDGNGLLGVFDFRPRLAAA
jgi:uncharacterized membrane protein